MDKKDNIARLIYGKSKTSKIYHFRSLVLIFDIGLILVKKGKL